MAKKVNLCDFVPPLLEVELVEGDAVGLPLLEDHLVAFFDEARLAARHLGDLARTSELVEEVVERVRWKSYGIEGGVPETSGE